MASEDGDGLSALFYRGCCFSRTSDWYIIAARCLAFSSRLARTSRSHLASAYFIFMYSQNEFASILPVAAYAAGVKSLVSRSAAK